MDKFVTSANIKHYRELLTIEADEHRRQQLCRLLVEEETKLEAALKKEKEKKMTFVIDPTFRRPMITAELVRHRARSTRCLSQLLVEIASKARAVSKRPQVLALCKSGPRFELLSRIPLGES